MPKILAFLLLFAFSQHAVVAQRLPKKKAILNVLHLTNDYFMNKWQDVGKTIITNKERPANIWTRAVYYEGLMELYKIDPQQRYYQYAVEWGEKHNWNFAWQKFSRNADNQCCFQTYIDLYLIDKQMVRIEKVKTALDSLLNSPKVDDWSWVDAIQMGMPVFAKLGKMYNNPAYFDRMYEMYAFTKYKHGGNGLYNAQEHLWWRDKDFVPPYKEPNGKNCYWSRGNGWVVMALARVLEQLPPSDPHYAEYLQDLKDMLHALIPIQRADGFWNVSLHDPTNYGGKETSGTAMFTYGMAWAINHGFVDKKTFLPVVKKAWNAMVKDAVHPNGKLGFVQSTGKEPKEGQPVTFDKTPDFEDYGLGAFLMAGVEVYKLR